VLSLISFRNFPKGLRIKEKSNRMYNNNNKNINNNKLNNQLNNIYIKISSIII